MKLHDPFVISPRLLPAVQVGGTWISIDIDNDRDHEGRTVYEYFIDFEDGTEYSAKDLRSGCQGGSIREGMNSLLRFMADAGEQYRFWHVKRGDPTDGWSFPLKVCEWCYMNSEELSMLAMELEENKNLIEEE